MSLFYRSIWVLIQHQSHNASVPKEQSNTSSRSDAFVFSHDSNALVSIRWTRCARCNKRSTSSNFPEALYIFSIPSQVTEITAPRRFHRLSFDSMASPIFPQMSLIETREVKNSSFELERTCSVVTCHREKWFCWAIRTKVTINRKWINACRIVSGTS